jgi:hypothetical protein
MFLHIFQPSSQDFNKFLLPYSWSIANVPKSPCGRSPIWQYPKIGKEKEKEKEINPIAEPWNLASS